MEKINLQQEFFAKHRSTVVAYIDASDLANSYAHLLKRLNDPNCSPDGSTDGSTDSESDDVVNVDVTHVVEQLQAELKKRSDWLLVVDNLDTSTEGYPQPGDTDWGGGRILLIPTVSCNEATTAVEHNLGKMEEKEALKLLQQTSGHEGKEKEARELVEFLGQVPFSIKWYLLSLFF